MALLISGDSSFVLGPIDGNVARVYGPDPKTIEYFQFKRVRDKNYATLYRIPRESYGNLPRGLLSREMWYADVRDQRPATKFPIAPMSYGDAAHFIDDFNSKNTIVQLGGLVPKFVLLERTGEGNRINANVCAVYVTQVLTFSDFKVEYFESVVQLPPLEGFDDVTGIDCNVCGEVADLRCAKCKNVTYCGRQCQISDWEKHRRSGCENKSL